MSRGILVEIVKGRWKPVICIESDENIDGFRTCTFLPKPANGAFNQKNSSMLCIGVKKIKIHFDTSQLCCGVVH
jgi:hypothetical protein